MKTSHFSFDLPERLIAQYPAEKRDESRLMLVRIPSGKIEHYGMKDFPELVPDNTQIVFNNTRVRKVRLFGTARETGGKVEFFLLKSLENNLWECMVSKSKKQNPGKQFVFPGGINGSIEGVLDKNKLVRFSEDINDQYLDKYGHIPLPPYIKRQDEKSDAIRYQSVFSRESGSMAAPTASLHFSNEIMHLLDDFEIPYNFVTLHVGLGTFAPVRTDNIEDHKMHSEDYEVSDVTAENINKLKQKGKNILSIGTTALRTLETVCKDGRIIAGSGATDIFIYPGYHFKAVSHLFTNFHTPQSSLLMLVSAFAGKEIIDNAYKIAIEKEYRFFSYGDAMLFVNEEL